MEKDSSLIQSRENYVVAPAWFPRTGPSIETSRKPEPETSEIVRNMRTHIASPAWAPRVSMPAELAQSEPRVEISNNRGQIVFPVVG